MTAGAAPTLDAVVDLVRADRLVDAEAACRALIAGDPDSGAAWQRLALICDRLGRPAEAIAYFEEAIRRLAEPGEAHHNLAVMLHQRGDPAAALPHYRRAIAAGLKDPRLHSNLGCLLRDVGQLQAGIAELEESIARDPALAEGHSNLGVALCLQGRIDLGLPHLRLATALRPDWQTGWSNLLLCLNYSDAAPAAVAAAHQLFGRRFARDDLPARTDPEPERPLRVGLVSPDFRQHSVAYFLEPLLEGHDPTRLAFYAYASASRHDGVSERLQRHCQRWRSIEGLTDDQAARLISADRIDILIDLAGHTAHNRLPLFARRPAPVQMTYLGYPNTTGLGAIDWRITDRWADPPGMTEGLYSERLLRLGDGFLCYRPRLPGPEVAPPPVATSGHVTFATFNQLAKVSPASLDLWRQILAEVPGARLVIKGPAFGDADTRAAFAARLPEAGFDPSAVTLLPPVADEGQHLAAYAQVDIALDTTPYHGTTTTCEALWMGVPVLTLAGASHAGRVGVSLLQRLGLGEFVAASPEAYVRLAVGLAADRARLRQLRTTLRARVVDSGLTDGVRFARTFEAGLRQAWAAWCAQARQAPVLAPPEGTRLLPMAGDLRVAVGTAPDDLTAYVLAEQHDWFEDEIAFVRPLVTRGTRAIDIGANHGVYALTIARAAGPDGRVFAFEPHPVAAERLRLSIAANGLAWLTLTQVALSDRTGRGHLSSGSQSELAGLVNSGATGIEVPLARLDELAAPLELGDVTFIKMDAEGAEPAILAGAREFLASTSPLLMFEVRHGTGIHQPTVDAVRAAGFDLYRLVPGLGVLMPAGALDRLDPFALNLFGAKPDRATALETRGLLAREIPDAGAAVAGSWLHHLRPTAIAQAIGARWRGPRTDVERSYLAALDHHALSHRPLDPPGARIAHLMAALGRMQPVLAASPSIAALHTAARLSFEAGRRADAAQLLNTAVQRCLENGELGDDLPFIAANPRFDRVPPVDGDVRRWALAAALEQRERLRAFSSFYLAGEPAARNALETLTHLGYTSDETTRRLTLIQQRTARPS